MRPSSSRAKVAIISGDDDNRLINFNILHRLSHRLLGCSDLDGILLETGLDVSNLYITPNYFRKGVRWNLRKYDLVINNVTDPDRNPKCLAVLSKLEREYGASFLNSPRYIAQIGRDRVAAIAKTIPGIVAPKTLRLGDKVSIEQATERAGFRWPGLLRPVGEHGGVALQIVRDAQEATERRNPREQHFLTEFVDFRSRDGLYRKIRFFVIGGEVLPRSMVIGNKWNLHRRDRDGSDTPPGVDAAAEEKRVYDYFAEGGFSRITEILLELAFKLKLDYFGVDCALLSYEQILLFEANPTMDFSGRSADPKRPHKSTRRPLAIEMTSRMIARALEARRADAGPSSLLDRTFRRTV